MKHPEKIMTAKQAGFPLWGKVRKKGVSELE